MDKYIKAQDAINAFAEYLWAPLPRSASYAQTIVDAIPAADVVPVVRGKWTWIVRRYYEEDGSYTLGEPIPVCSQCGKRPPLDVASSFCPYCGARMDGKEDG